jgi:hypothetical protein
VGKLLQSDNRNVCVLPAESVDLDITQIILMQNRDTPHIFPDRRNRNMAYNECSYCFVTMNMKVTDGTVVLHTAYNECSN